MHVTAVALPFRFRIDVWGTPVENLEVCFGDQFHVLWFPVSSDLFNYFVIIWIITCLILSITFSCIFFNRISIIFRKGQFKKVHLPDRTLLRHMAMIMAVAFGYLVAWTAANNDFSQMKKTSSGLKFVMCTENWWSYSAYGSK